MRFDYASTCPRTYAVLKDLKGLCLNSSEIWNSFHRHSGTSKNEVSHILSIGTNPTVILVNNLTNRWNQTTYGIFNASYGAEYIRVRKNVVNGLEIAKLEGTVFATGFFLSMTILHELVHYCRYHKKLKEYPNEYGKGFEISAIGFSVELDNVSTKYLQFKGHFENLKNVYQKQKSGS